MRSRWLMYGLLFLCASPVHAGEVLDGILATVKLKVGEYPKIKAP